VPAKWASLGECKLGVTSGFHTHSAWECQGTQITALNSEALSETNSKKFPFLSDSPHQLI